MGALSGFKVIELSGIGPGPLCGMLLSDLGAEVIRIDRSHTAIPQADAKFDITGRNKKSICLNLKDDSSKEIFFKLIKDADALIEGYRPGVTEKLGIGPNDCFKINPKLVYGRITGWGQSGPLSQSAGHDINSIALAGALFSIGQKDSKPSIPINLIGDYGGGTMFLAFGVCAALLSVSKTGKGQVVDAAMIDGVSSLLTILYSLSQSGIWKVKDKEKNLLDGGSPFYQVYETQDKKYISIGSLEPQFYQLLLEKLNLNEESKNHQMDMTNWPNLTIKLEKLFKTKTQNEWNELLENTDVCYAPVLSIDEAKDHHHMKERENFISINDVVQPSPAPRFSETKSDQPKKAPKVGENSEEILSQLGYTNDEINSFKERKIIN